MHPLLTESRRYGTIDLEGRQRTNCPRMLCIGRPPLTRPCLRCLARYAALECVLADRVVRPAGRGPRVVRSLTVRIWVGIQRARVGPSRFR
jgi:hypothetical protein